ncbi:MAG TPA: DUF488 domain-containing protein [Candidatus Saccharimonadales bacterium]|jgi:uncharacterized protein (DUF488 family)|nr:DUF488 domain-containing protein [Candidatus Saccharimonadales bacterium]
MTGTVYSIGHGTATAEEFTRTLTDAGVRLLTDIRSAPGSRRNPQFGQSALRDTLAAAGIEYVHLPGLGGRRAPRRDSPHPSGLRVAAFRGYADHMASDEFAADLARLEEFARLTPSAFMCAETLWWKCHRRLLADRMTADGWTVVQLRVGGPPEPHRLTDAARVEQGRLSYD